MTTQSRARRVVSLWLPRFATDRIARAEARAKARQSRSRPAAPPAETPSLLVTVAPEGGALCLAAVSRAAEAAGLFPGQGLADARALAPHLAVRDADPAGDRAAAEAIAGWCLRYTPWAAAGPAETGGAAGIWLDVTGCAHLFGGERALLDDLLARLARFGYGARAGLADTPGAAWALARFAAPPAEAAHIAPPGGQAAALAALPLAALRLPAATVGALDRLGLRRVQDLAALPRAGLARRFGDATLARLDQALGRVAEPVSPRPPAPVWRLRTSFPEPLGADDAIAEAAGRLAEALCDRLARAGRGAHRLELCLFRTAGRVDTLMAGTSRASRDPVHLARLLREKLDRLPAPPTDAPDPLSAAAEAAVETITLAATATEPLPAEQTCWNPSTSAPPPPHPARSARHPLPPKGAERVDAGASLSAPLGGGEGRGEVGVRTTPTVGRGPDPAALDRLVDRLAGRLGPDGVLRFRLRESHLPERAQAGEPALSVNKSGQLGIEKKGSFSQQGPDLVTSVTFSPPRPPRLLARPEPVEAVAPVPDDPPLVFRWRGRLHRVARAEGPERIAPEWWHEPAGLVDDQPPRTRDYYRVEDEGGRRFWLYREGLWDGAPADRPPRWFLHGLFG